MAHRKIEYLCCIFALAVSACKHNPDYTDVGGYPAAVGKIIVNKCATAGCHNNASYKAAGGLNLSTWNDLFLGGASGTAVIPYRSDFSTLCYYTNAYSDLGITLQPRMPLDQTPLTRNEYLTIRNWVNMGAPNAAGIVKFADNPNRAKIYVANRLCDVVTVFDAASLLQMRYIDVGKTPAQEFPYTVHVSPDKKNWYVSFFSYSSTVQKFDAVNDKPAGEINLGTGSWLSFALTSDSRYGYFVSNDAIGKILYADVMENKVLAAYTFGNNLKYPVGIGLCEEAHKLYVGAMSGNYIYSINISNPLEPVIIELPIDGTQTTQYNTSLDPVDLCVDENSKICYAACVNSNDIRVLDMTNDKLLKVISIGAAPAYMTYSPLVQKLFVTCPDDTVSFPGSRGSVAIIDGTTQTLVRKLNTGFQPFGIAVNESLKVAAVANANLRPDGNAPHHVTGCGGRNGNVTFIDINTLMLKPMNRSEVAVFPYGVDAR